MMYRLNMFSCLLNSENISTSASSLTGAFRSTSMPRVVNHWMKRGEESYLTEEVEHVAHRLEVTRVVCE